ncbi:GntR family transcriptional regulator [Paenibacillus sp. DS2015]|uniref:GntR family transcriptional regulator n=1 Tax=Paenibacillus sp. DS2015 TaxID=3373917 RepID=UPI003D1AA250
MIIQLDMQSDIPIYSQLMNQIIEGIASGALQPGEPLPSVRSLASDIGVNLHTVNKAYTLLKQDGFIQIHRQKGVVIQPEEMPGVTPEYVLKQHSQLKPIIAEALCRGLTQQQLSDIMKQIHAEITHPGKENV